MTPSVGRRPSQRNAAFIGRPQNIDIVAANSTASTFLGQRRPDWMTIVPLSDPRSSPTSPSRTSLPAVVQSASSSSPEPERISPGSSPKSTVTPSTSGIFKAKLTPETPLFASSTLTTAAAPPCISPKLPNQGSATEALAPSRPLDSSLNSTELRESPRPRLSPRPTPAVCSTQTASPREVLARPCAFTHTAPVSVSIQSGTRKRGRPPLRNSIPQPAFHFSPPQATRSSTRTDQTPASSLTTVFDAILLNYRASYRLSDGEQNRCAMLRDACTNNDLWLLSLHQVLCWRLTTFAAHFVDKRQEGSAALISTIFDIPSTVKQSFYKVWYSFPTYPENPTGKEDPYSRTVVSTFEFLSRFEAAFIEKVRLWRIEGRPPLIEELLSIGIFSVTFQRLTFSYVATLLYQHIPKQLWVDLHRVLDSDIAVHMSSSYSPQHCSQFVGAYFDIGRMYHSASSPASPTHGQPTLQPPTLSLTRSIKQPLLPSLNASTDIPAVPDPIAYGMHMAHAMDPPVIYTMQTNPNDVAFQYVSSFLAGPVHFDASEYIQRCHFDLSDPLYSRRAHQDPPSREGALPAQKVHSETCRFRLSGKKGALTNDLSEWISRGTYWPNLSIFQLNDENIELRRKEHFGRCLPSDITHLLCLGENNLAIFSLAGRFRAKPQDDLPQYTFAVELIEIASGCQIEEAVLARTKPMAESLAMIVGPGIANDNDSDDLISTTVTISLVDPISRTSVWKIPVRGKGCKHADAFDLDTFLQSRRSGKRLDEASDIDVWKCPICLGDARPSVLIADGWFLHIRGKLEEQGRLDARRISVDGDGAWKVVEEQQQHLSAQKQPQRPEDEKLISEAGMRREIEIIELD